MKISQREARRLKKETLRLSNEIDEQRRAWSQQYFGGTDIGRFDCEPNDPRAVAVRTARKLNHAVVVVGDDGGTLRLLALPHPKA